MAFLLFLVLLLECPRPIFLVIVCPAFLVISEAVDLVKSLVYVPMVRFSLENSSVVIEAFDDCRSYYNYCYS
jgi:hypothetical protein